MEMTPMAHPVSVRLEDRNKENVDRFAKMTRRSRSFIINEAVEEYLRDRVRYLTELDEAVEDAHSGYGHSSEQIHTWMESWDTDHELASPEPDILPSNR
jgi:predicted transcriptional regulator